MLQRPPTGDRKPALPADSRIKAVLDELIRREPIFHRPEFGTTRHDFERMTDPGFWEVGASGRRYSREYIIEALLERFSSPHEDVWEAGGFECTELAPDTYLITYTLVQHRTRVTRRATIWRRTGEEWKILYHQGTIVAAPPPAMSIAIRPAAMADACAIKSLIEESVRGLSSADYSVEIIEAALRSAWGLDTQLLEDGTYYLVTIDNELAACGGWSFRKTLFGSDAMSSRDSSRLLPGQDAARIRAFFVRPSFARRGLASQLLLHCEQEARIAGFQSLSLGATEPGRRLYRTHGFVEGTPVDYDLGGGLTMKIIPMSKSLVS